MSKAEKPPTLTEAQGRCLEYAGRMASRPGRGQGEAYYSAEYPQRCFAVLERHGLVKMDAGGNFYRITDAGRAHLLREY